MTTKKKKKERKPPKKALFMKPAPNLKTSFGSHLLGLRQRDHALVTMKRYAQMICGCRINPFLVKRSLSEAFLPVRNRVHPENWTLNSKASQK